MKGHAGVLRVSAGKPGTCTFISESSNENYYAKALLSLVWPSRAVIFVCRIQKQHTFPWMKVEYTIGANQIQDLASAVLRHFQAAQPRIRPAVRRKEPKEQPQFEPLRRACGLVVRSVVSAFSHSHMNLQWCVIKIFQIYCCRARVTLSKERESVLNLWRRAVNLRPPERARNEWSTGPKSLDDTRCKTYK